VVTKTKTTKIMIGVLEVVVRAAMDIARVDVEVGTGWERVVNSKARQEEKVLLMMNWWYVGLNYVNLSTNLTSSRKRYTWPTTVMWSGSEKLTGSFWVKWTRRD
jgi:hypothetical protein